MPTAAADKLIEQFLSMKSQSTRRTYRSALFGLEVFTGKKVERLSASEILDYFVALRQQQGQLQSPISYATIKHRFHVFSSIYSFLSDMEAIRKNPMNAVRRMISWRQEAQKRPTALVNATTIRKLLRLPIPGKAGVRDRGIFGLLFGAGLRRSEALALNVEDVQVSPWGNLYVELKQSKAGKRQLRVVAPFAKQPVVKLVTQRSGEGAAKSDPLICFYYKDGRVRGRLDAKTLYRRFRNACAMLGVAASPHAARATFATMLKEIGIEDRDAGRALGHSSGNMVSVYDKRSNEIDGSPVVRLKKVVG